jgi:two-component system NtrC family sensor kinase
MLVSIFEAMQDGVCIVRDDYTLEFMNKIMVQAFGQGVGNKCYRVLEEREDICPWCKAKDVFAGNTIRNEHAVSRLNKTYDVIELPMKTAGRVAKLSIYRDITQRKRREEKIRALEEDYKRLFEHLGCGVYISSKEGKFLNANQAMVEMLGYDSKEEFLDIDITKDLYLRPHDRTKFREMIERDGKVIDYEVEFKRKDGTPIPVLLTANVRYDSQGNVLGYEGINVDQTQRNRMEKELKETNDFLNKMIQSSPNAIIAVDSRGNIMVWNQAAEGILGYKAEEVIGKMNIEKIYPFGAEEAKKMMQMMRSLDYGGVGTLRSYPMVIKKRDGGIVEVNFSAAIIYDADGKEVGSVGIIVDLTARLEMERVLRQTQEQLLQSEKLAAMGRLTSQVAHELNNPLYGIMNTLELMKTEISPDNKRRKVLDMALSETVRLTELLRKMLSFSKPDEEERQVTAINAILDEILLLHEKQLRENDIRTEQVLDENLKEVFASKNQLRQVFLNMIANARDAMPDGGTLTVRTKNEGDTVHTLITDTGTGIREENLDKIFDAFFTTKDSVKDVGLGLSVCYGFIKDHGGDITVTSEVGAGTTFTIILPALTETDTKEDPE